MGIFDKVNGGSKRSSANWVNGKPPSSQLNTFGQYPKSRPFRRRANEDEFDIRDSRAPQDEAADIPSPDFHRCVQSVTACPTKMDTMDYVTTDGGVRKRVFQEGTGAPDQVKDDYRVWIHYDTYLDGGPEMKLDLFDGTFVHGMSTSLKIGEDGITGLQLGIKTMRIGEISEFTIAPEYAYGKRGIIGFIAKNQTLRMIVELKEVRDNHRTPIFFMTFEERRDGNFTLDQYLAEVDGLHKAGNVKFQKQLYLDARDRYKWALDLLKEYSARDTDTLIDSTSITAHILDLKSFKIYCNLAIAHIRLEDYEDAEKICESALKLRHHEGDLKPKVVYRQAFAMFKQGKFELANDICRRALQEDSTTWGHAQFRDLQYKVESGIMRQNALTRTRRCG